MEQQQLAAALRRLPERGHLVVVLRYLEDLPANEVAEATGLTEANVRQIARRALGALRSMLAAGWRGDENWRRDEGTASCGVERCAATRRSSPAFEVRYEPDTTVGGAVRPCAVRSTSISVSPSGWPRRLRWIRSVSDVVRISPMR